MDNDPSSSHFIVGLVLCYLLSTLFSVIKIVFSALNKNAIPADAERLRFYASKIEDLEENRPLLTATVSFGKSVANIAFSLLSLGLFAELYPLAPWYQVLGLAFAFSVAVLTVLAHFVPRAFAMRYGEALAPPGYTLYVVLSWLFLPFSSALLGVHNLLLRLLHYDQRFAFLSQEEKARMNEEMGEEEGLDEEEREMIHSIFELGETTVEEIMVPRVDIGAIEMNANLETTLRIIREEGHSRIPIYKETIDTIVGVLYVKDLLTWVSTHSAEEWNLDSVMKKPDFVPASKKIDEMMKEFRRKHIHMSVVVDEYGGTAGIVTLEDILEEIVGEIQDEYDVEEKAIQKVEERRFYVDPHVDLHDFNEELDINLDLEDVSYNTLGGLIYHQYGEVPEVGTVVEYGGLRIKVLKMDNQRIQKVEVEILSTRPEKEKEESVQGGGRG